MNSMSPHARPLFAVALLVSLLGLGCVSGSRPSGSEDSARRQALARYNLGLNHLSEGRTALAIRELQTAVSHDPDDVWIHLALAEAYRRKAKVEEAERHLRIALELDPSSQHARLSLSGLLVQLGRFEEAEREAQLLVDDPSFPAPWRGLTNLGWAQYKLGHYAEARRNLSLAVEYRPDFWPALLDLGILEVQEGHRLEGIKRFEQVLELGPGPLAEAETNYRIAEVYVSLGRREDAVAHLSVAAKTRPSGSWGQRSEEYLELLR